MKKVKIATNVPDPPTKEEMDEYFRKEDLRQKAMERATCPGCHNGFDRLGGEPVRFEDRYWHISCRNRWQKWRAEWFQVWTEIGWHAKIELVVEYLRKEDARRWCKEMGL